MSAYLCATDTFDYLASFAQAACTQARFGGRDITVYAKPEMPDVPALVDANILDSRHDRVSGHNPSDVAAILRAENLRSLNARYGESAATFGDDGYTFQRINQTDPVTVLKSLHCLRYQSCEAEDYGQTLASALLDAIERAAINALPGYNDAPWGWTRPAQTATV